MPNSILRLKLTVSGFVHVITQSQDLALFAFILQSRCSYLHIFLNFGSRFLFYFLLTEIYTTPFPFIDIVVSIVTQHMIIYETFA